MTRTRNFWQFSYKALNPEVFYAFVFVPPRAKARCFIMPSGTAMQRWNEYKEKALARGVKHERWGVNWADAKDHEDKWDILPG